MNILRSTFGFLVLILVAAVGELVSDEIRARLDRLPMAVLRAAARRLPPEQRAELYGQAWLPELRHILQGDQAVPITRLIHGIRYALRLWLSAPQIGRELNPGAPATLTRRMLRFVFSPTYLVAINALPIPFTAAIVAVAARQPTWFMALFAAALIVNLGLLATFGRRLMIRRHGFAPSREMFCQCVFSTTIRALIIPVTTAATSAATVLASVAPLSRFSIAYALAAFSFLGAHAMLMKFGFGLRVSRSG